MKKTFDYLKLFIGSFAAGCIIAILLDRGLGLVLAGILFAIIVITEIICKIRNKPGVFF